MISYMKYKFSYVKIHIFSNATLVKYEISEFVYENKIIFILKNCLTYCDRHENIHYIEQS